MLSQTCDVCGKKLRRNEGIKVPGPDRPIRVHLECANTPRGAEVLGEATGRSAANLFPRPPREKEQ